MVIENGATPAWTFRVFNHKSRIANHQAITNHQSRITNGIMDIETLGHAGLLIRDGDGEPLLFTDPWITGSCYWRSWWLQNYPGDELVAELRRVRYCFISHEHPDHFHTASIRFLGRQIEFLSPELPQEHIARYLADHGYRVSVVPA